MTDILSADVTRLALCWRIVRSDGVALGLTTHDRSLLIDGLIYASAPGMAPSAITRSAGIDVDTMEIDGALSASAVTAADLAGGRYDGANVAVFAVDWSNPGAGRQHLARGTLGEIRRAGSAGSGTFSAELRGPTAAFDATVIESYAPECRAELGDQRCRVNLAPITMVSVVTAVTDDQAVGIALPAGRALGDFAGGRMRALTGANAGIDAIIADVSDAALLLFEPMPFALAVGTRIELRVGCDKRLATCANRFGNVVNFRGEPHVPGGDVLTRFPGV